MFKTLVKNARQAAHELSEMERLFSPENTKLRELVFFGESDIYWYYYVDYIEHILANSDREICYLSSDLDDPVFKKEGQRIKPFFIKNLLAAALAKLDAKVLIMGTPDINKGVVKRAPDPVHHVYAFRGIASTHQAYRLGAFDHYDTLLCIAQYQIDEVRKTEEIYRLKPKKLPLIGYPPVERLYREHQIYKTQRAPHPDDGQICLVAPTWDPLKRGSSLMDNCIDEMLEPLAKSGFQVWLRPHPEFFKRFPKKIEAIRKQMIKYPNLSFQMEFGSMQCLHEADVLITDHSSIAMDYVIATERPVLYIDTPTRVDNPECDRLGMEPIENKYRSKFGACLSPSELKNVPVTLKTLVKQQDEFRKQVPSLRELLIANWQQAKKVGGDYILYLCER